MVVTDVDGLLARHDTVRLTEQPPYEAYKESLRAQRHLLRYSQR